MSPSSGRGVDEFLYGWKMDVDFRNLPGQNWHNNGKLEVAVKSGEGWRVVSNFVYGNTVDGTSGGTLRSTNGAGQD